MSNSLSMLAFVLFDLFLTSEFAPKHGRVVYYESTTIHMSYTSSFICVAVKIVLFAIEKITHF